MPPKKAPAKKKGGYVLPEKFNKGFIVKDIFKNSWEIGDPIGQGGFGLIYSASKCPGNKITDNSEFVIKIEPKDNGPLFCETHFYANCAKEDDINAFAKAYRLKHVGIPKSISSGLCDYNDKSYRFIVMNRFIKDLQSILEANQGILKESTVLYLLRQILHSLEYIHSKGYAHGDIKAANIMLKSDKEAYLLDYGLVHRFSRDGTHQAYQPKPDRRHNGTIEFTSRDAHAGVTPNRRADLEILVYCVIQWLSGTLPWMDVLNKPEEVQKLKVKYMEKSKEFLDYCFKKTKNNVQNKILSLLEFLITEVNSYDYEDEPNYMLIHTRITETLKACGYSNDENFELLKPSATKTNTTKKTVQSAKKINPIIYDDEESDVEDKVHKKIPIRVSDTSEEEMQAKKDNKKKLVAKSKMDEEKLRSPYSGRRKIVQESDEEIEPTTKLSSPALVKHKINMNSPRLQAANDENSSRQLRNHKKVDYTQMFLIKEEANSKKATTKEIINDSSQSDEEDDCKAAPQPPVKPRTPLLTSRQFNKLDTIAISPQINRAKLLEEKQSKSPLALSNLNDTETNVQLIRKRKNIQKVTVSTQTDVSCFAR